MFVRRLVSGVRSSCDASATSWRWARFESSSPASIELKLVARRLSSSRPLTSMRSREIACLRDALGGLREPADRCQRSARHNEPERGSDPDSRERNDDEEEAETGERLVHLGQRTRDLDGVTGLVRDGQRPDMRPIDLSLRDNRLSPRSATRQIERLVRSGEFDIVVELTQRVPVGLDDLDQGVRLAEALSDAEEGFPIPQRDLGQRDPENLLSARSSSVSSICALSSPRTAKNPTTDASTTDRATAAAAPIATRARKLMGRLAATERGGESGWGSCPALSGRGHEGETLGFQHPLAGDREPKANGADRSRRAYPTPRTVWIRRGLPSGSVFLRR